MTVKFDEVVGNPPYQENDNEKRNVMQVDENSDDFKELLKIRIESSYDPANRISVSELIESMRKFRESGCKNG